MNIHQSPGMLRDKTGRKNAHESREYHQRRMRGGVKTSNALGQCGVKRLAAGISFVVQLLGSNAYLTRQSQPRRIGLVADHTCHARTEFASPIIAFCGFRDGQHVGAAA